MNFLIIKNDIYSQIPKLIMENFPDFKSIFDLDEGDYLIFGDFYNNYIAKNIENKDIIEKVCKFIDLLLNFEDYRIKELIQIEVFEHFIYDKNMFQKFELYLNDNSKSLLNNFLSLQQE